MRKTFLILLIFVLFISGCGDSHTEKKKDITELRVYQEIEGEFKEVKLFDDYVLSINSPVEWESAAFPYTNKICQNMYMIITTNWRQIEIKIFASTAIGNELFLLQPSIISLIGTQFKEGEIGEKVTFILEDDGKKYYLTQYFKMPTTKK